MKKIPFILFALILTACATPTPAPTLTAIPPTPSATAIATLTLAATLTPTLEAAPTPILPEAIEIKNFPSVKPENFKENEISEEELFDGTYFAFLEREAKKLSCSPDMRTDVPMINAGGMIIPNYQTAPNWTGANRGKEFFIRDKYFGITHHTLSDGQVVDYAVMPLFVCDKKDSAKVYPIITVYSTYAPGQSQKKMNAFLPSAVGVWKKSMNTTPIISGDSYIIGSRAVEQDPLVAKTFVEHSDIEARFTQFAAGDYSALSESGDKSIVVLNVIATNSAHWFE